MATKLTMDSFLDVLQRSGLIAAEQVECTWKELEEEGVDLETPQAAAQELVARKLLTEWQADNLLQGKHKGFFLGPYRFLRLLGKGGMGAVYLAEHEMMRRRCAIKVLPSKQIRHDSSMLERFYREAQAVAALDDPNIVRAYDVNKSVQGKTEIHYLVMEYIEGQDLQVLVEERGAGLDYAEAADYTRQAANGLSHAHDSGLIHRDIKPANLLVDRKGVVKILDLGLARFFDDQLDASLTSAYGESTLGTADYLSPEQALDSHDVDTRTDIYSLGCTLYFMLTGRPPFPEGTVAQRLISHQVKSPAPIAKFRPDVPQDLVAIVDKMIAKKPEDRFQTAAEVADVLASWLIQHTDDQWKQEHPEFAAEGLSGASLSRREPTRSITEATADTETELGFAPLDDEDEEEVLPVTEDSSKEDSSKEDSSSSVETPPSVAVEEEPESPAPEIEELQPIEHRDLMDELTTGSAEGALEVDLSEPLEDHLLAEPLESRPAVGSGARLRAASGSGVKSRRDDEPKPEAAIQKSHVFWLLLIGVGVSVPLGLVSLIIYRSVYPASGNNVAVSSPQPSPAESQPPVPGGQMYTAEFAQPPSGAAVGQAPPGRPPTQPPPAAAAAPTTQPPTQPPPEQPVSEPPLEQPPEPAPEQPPQQPATQPPPQQPATQPPPQQPATQPPPDTAAPASYTPEVDPVAATPPGGQVSPGAPATPGPTPAAPPGAGKTEPDKPALSPQQARQMFAEIREVAFKLDSADNNPRSKLNTMIARAAIDAVNEADLTPYLGAPDDRGTVLSIQLKGENTTQAGRIGSRPVIVFTLSAELICLQDEQEVTVWKHSHQIGTVAPELVKRGNYQNILRKEVDQFFKQFVRDHREAVSSP